MRLIDWERLSLDVGLAISRIVTTLFSWYIQFSTSVQHWFSYLPYHWTLSNHLQCLIVECWLLLFQDGSFDLATVIRAAGSYRRLHRYEPVHDYVQLTNQEFEHYYENNLKYVFLLNQLQNPIGILGFTTRSVFNNFILWGVILKDVIIAIIESLHENT